MKRTGCMLKAVGSSGSSFAFNDYDYDNTNSNVGSHLEDFNVSIDLAHMAKNNCNSINAVVPEREAEF